MKKEGIGHITPVGGNVFLDLGFPPDEATALLAESKELIRLEILAQSKKSDKSHGSEDGHLPKDPIR